MRTRTLIVSAWTWTHLVGYRHGPGRSGPGGYAGTGLAEDLERLAGVGWKSKLSRFAEGNLDRFQS